jgi:asparagine synthase (glutamine-hydrolysing)
VRIHLRSDVPVSVLLSAGLDSAGIAALAARAGGEVSAVSAGYAGDHACDERGGARATARALGVRCLEVEMDAGEFATLFDDLTLRCDEPPCDIASMAQWALYRACRALGFKVVLSGVGGDEIFFGYPTWNRAGEQLARRARRHRSLPPVLRAGARRVEGLLPRVSGSFGPAWPGTWTGVVDMHRRPLRWLGADPLGRSSADADAIALDLEDRAAPGPDAIYAFLTGAYLPNNGFQLADKLGMGNSVEVRVPLADHVLFERAVGLPLARRFSHGETKPLLKRLIRPYLPAEVLARPKQGFAPPGTFVRAVVERHAEAILTSDDLRGWLDTPRLRAMISAYLADPVVAGAAPPRLSKLDHVARKGRMLVNGGFFPDETGWMLFSLAAFVRCREGWR